MYTKSRRAFNICMNILFVLLCVLFIAPFLLVVSISLTPEHLISTDGYQLIPKHITFDAYKFIFSSGTSLCRSYLVTIIVTVLGTAGGLVITSMLAYPISRKDLKYKNVITFFLFFTMLFNGGLVASYLLITRYLRLKNTILVLILPLMVNAWNVILMRNFFSTSVPDGIIEAAKIDGAGEFLTFVKIIVPISKPAFATVGLFIALAYWNDWWTALLYIDDRSLFTLQYTLQSILLNIQVLMGNIQTQHLVKDVPAEGSRMALCILAIGPIVLAYPFFQKYIVKGLTIGAIK